MGTHLPISILYFFNPQCTMITREQLEQEVQRLRHELSVTIPQEIKNAVELGDLRENSEYSAALEKQHFVGVRLEQMMQRLRAYHDTDTSRIPRDRVGIGSVAKVRNMNTGNIEYFRIVMHDIADDEDGKIQEVTMNSPIGKTLMNTQVKDEVTAYLPAEKISYRILQITTIHDQ